MGKRQPFETQLALMAEQLRLAKGHSTVTLVHPDLPGGTITLTFPSREIPRAPIEVLVEELEVRPEVCGRIFDTVFVAIERVLIEEALLSCIDGR